VRDAAPPTAEPEDRPQDEPSAPEPERRPAPEPMPQTRAAPEPVPQRPPVVSLPRAPSPTARETAPSAAEPRLYGPPAPSRPRDSARVGTAPNGQPLYAAAWYREPRDQEMRGYLSTASPGYAVISCRTVPDFRVEDCVADTEWPRGSGMARAVLAMAW